MYMGITIFRLSNWLLAGLFFHFYSMYTDEMLSRHFLPLIRGPLGQIVCQIQSSPCRYCVTRELSG